MGKKSRLKERQVKNKLKKLVDLAEQNKIVDPEVANAMQPLSPELQNLYDSVVPAVISSLDKDTVYLMTPLMQVLSVDPAKGRYMIRAKMVKTTEHFKLGQVVNYPIKSITDAEGIAIFATAKEGKVFTPQVEKVEIEKEVVKTQTTGIKQKDVEKAIEKTLHQYKNTFHFEANKRLFDEFLSNLK